MPFRILISRKSEMAPCLLLNHQNQPPIIRLLVSTNPTNHKAPEVITAVISRYQKAPGV